MKVTVLSVKENLLGYPVGTVVEFQKDLKNAYDKEAIMCLVNGANIGYVAGNPSYLGRGCSTNKEFHKEFKNDTIKGTVVEHTTIAFNNGQKRTALVIEVVQAERKRKGGNGMKHNAIIKGNIRSYPGKTEVIKAIEGGNAVFVSLSVDDKSIVAEYNNVPAGVVDKGEGYDDLFEAITIAGRVNAKVISLKGTSYVVEIDINESTFNEKKEASKTVTHDDLKKKIISEGIVEEKEILAIEEYLEKNGVSRKLINKIFSSYKKYPEEYQDRIPKNPEKVYEDTTGIVKKSIAYISVGSYLNYVGEKGTGKNVMLNTLAWIYQRPVFSVAVHKDLQSQDLLGDKTFEQELTPEGKEKLTLGFDKEAFVQGMECGGIVNMDEINTADPGLLTILHPIMDGRREINVPGYGLVRADENFTVVCTMNEGYEGTVPMNDATKDRITHIIFPQPSEIQTLLLKLYPNADLDDIRYCDQIYKGIRALVDKRTISASCLSIRGFEVAIRASEFLDLKDGIIDNIVNKIDDSLHRTYVSNIVDDVLG